MKKVAVVVPVYRSFLTKHEQISYKQLFSVLRKYDIYFVVPQGLELQFDILNAACMVFDTKFFMSTETYSQLLLSKMFYSRFSDYEYILIHQLDALVFSDQLNDFCEMGFDYIGAPWVSGFSDYLRTGLRVLHVGNGGLSLRNVQHCIRALEENKNLLEMFSGRNEDVFFSSCDSNEFRVAPMEIAIRFSFEREVKRCFELNRKELPFGCHAWEKYDRSFWIVELKKIGYQFESGEDNDGNEDEKHEREYRWLEGNALVFENREIRNALIRKMHVILEKNKAQGFYLWGAGYFGRSMRKFMCDYGVPVQGFIDSNPMLDGKIVDGMSVCSAKFVPDSAVIIVVTEEKHYHVIEDALKIIKCQKNITYFKWKDFLPEVSYVSS